MSERPIVEISELPPGDKLTELTEQQSTKPFWRGHHMWWLLVLVLVSIPPVLMQSQYDEVVGRWMPESFPNLSTYNKRASGYSGFYELAGKLHLPVQRWQSSYRELEKPATVGTLVIIDPNQTPSDADCEFIANWVKRGNDLVYLDRIWYGSDRRLLKAVSLDAAGHIAERNLHLPVADRYPEAQHVSAVVMASEAKIIGGQPVVRDALGNAIISTTNFGDGRVLAGVDPRLCVNEYLADPAYKGNFQFLANWLQTSKQPIMFDEKCHGFTSGTNVFVFILRSPVGFIILQLLIIAVVAFFSLNQRFGRPRVVANARRISNLEFIDGLSTTYRRARARNAAWAMLFNPFKSRLCKTLSVPPHESSRQLASVWADATGGNAKQYEDFLQQAEAALDKSYLSEEELTALVATCDKLAGGARQVVPLGKIMGA